MCTCVQVCVCVGVETSFLIYPCRKFLSIRVCYGKIQDSCSKYVCVCQTQLHAALHIHIQHTHAHTPLSSLPPAIPTSLSLSLSRSQASDITGGIYIKVPEPAGLLQFLIVSNLII